MQAVQALLSALPMRADFEEAAPVYNTLCQLVTDPGMAARLGSLMPRILQASSLRACHIAMWQACVDTAHRWLRRSTALCARLSRTLVWQQSLAA